MSKKTIDVDDERVVIIATECKEMTSEDPSKRNSLPAPRSTTTATCSKDENRDNGRIASSSYRKWGCQTTQ